MLDEYSSKQRERLAKLRPDWIPYFSESPHKEADTSYLLVKIPSPGNAEDTLFLYTSDEEVTIAFGVWEWHFPDPSNPAQEELETAVDRIAKLQNDELVIVSSWLDKQWLGSRIIAPEEPLVIPDFAVDAKSVKVLSWSGRLNREVTL